MIMLVFTAALAFVLAALTPTRLGVIGFLLAALVLFAVPLGLNAASGFEGVPISESLELFGGSYASYFGFNLQITFRAFAGPLLILSAVYVFRLARRG